MEEILLPVSPEISSMFYGWVALGASALIIGEYITRRNTDRIVNSRIERKAAREMEETRSKYGHGFSEDSRLCLYQI